MTDYNKHLNSLFGQFLDTHPDIDRCKFCPDGLMEQGSGVDVGRKWAAAKRRIAFLVKDCPDGWGTDTRTWLGVKAGELRNSNGGRSQFWEHIAILLHNLYLLTPEGIGCGEINVDAVKATASPGYARILQSFNEIPFAYIECKKDAGDKDCSPAELRAALNRYAPLLKAEIDLLHPNILVCCDKEGLIFDTVCNTVFAGAAPDSVVSAKYPDSDFDYCYAYYAMQNVLVINSYHPSYIPRGGAWKIIECVMASFRHFIKSHPDF